MILMFDRSYLSCVKMNMSEWELIDKMTLDDARKVRLTMPTPHSRIKTIILRWSLEPLRLILIYDINNTFSYKSNIMSIKKYKVNKQVGWFWLDFNRQVAVMLPGVS